MSASRPDAGRGARRHTREQETAIRAADHLLIEAGAGSGKTTTLVAKILHALGAEVIPGERAARPCELDAIAAITFTRAAAADLRRKLRDAVRRVAEETGDPRWLARVYEVDRARIGTIHGFCAGILRECALRVGIDPAFAVLEESDAAALRDACARDTLLDALRASEPRAIALVSACGTSGAGSLVAAAVAAGESADQARAAWCGTESGGVDVSRLAERIAGARAAWALGDEAPAWHDVHDPAVAELAGTVLHLAAAARDVMLERMARIPAFDFDALITRTRDVLRDRPAVLAAVRERLAWLFVDELQDTDPAQLDIVYRLCGFGPFAEPGGDAAPRLCIVGDPKQSIYRFRRADVSVWGTVLGHFQAAGIAPVALTTNFRSRAPIVGYVNATFHDLIGRGTPGVHAAGHEVAYTPLTAHREAPRDDGVVELLAVPPAATASERRALEAALVAARLREMVAGEPIVHDDEAEPPTFRRPAWRDVALLFRWRTGVALYEAALRAAGIPCHVVGGDGFFESRAVRDVQQLLAALLDPRDDVAWLGLLRSPFAALRDETILRHRLAAPGAPLSAVLDDPDAAGPDAERVRFVAHRVATLRAMRDRVAAGTLVRHAVAACGYAAQAAFRIDGDAELANLQKLAQLADGRPDLSLAELAAHLRARADGAAREGEAPLYTAGEDVVTLTTVHGAKGLEWPVVVLCDLERDITTSRQEALLLDRDAGIGLKVPRVPDDGGKPVAPGAWTVLHARERALGRAEEKRLWYVATTRARDRLVLCVASEREGVAADAPSDDAPSGDGARSVREWLTRALTPREGYFVYTDGARSWTAGETVLDAPAAAAGAGAAPAPPTMGDLAGAPPLEPAVCRRVARGHAALALPPRSATELMALERDPDWHRDAYVLGLPDRRLFARAGGRGRAGVPARIMGGILHRSLEELRADEELDRFHEHELTMLLGEPAGSGRVRAAVEKLRELVRIAREHPSVAALYDDPRSERELPFTWLRRRGDGGVSLLHGAMDLVGTPFAGAPEILDFKSGDVRPGDEGARAAEYRVQRDLYAEALRAITGTAPAAFTFFFPGTGVPVRHDLLGEGADARLARLDALLARTASTDLAS